MRILIPTAAALCLLVASCRASLPPQSSSARQPEPPAYFTPDPATAATVTGSVTLKGPRPKRAALRIDEDPGCTKMNRSGLLEETAIVNAKGAVANVFIYIRDGLEDKQFAPPPPVQHITIDQRGCRFEPHVIGVRTGQLIRVTNSDPLTHNIHPMPRMNREWNQSQEEGAPALERKFARPEIMMRVKCNVHSWMRAYISVMDHPYFAVTSADGAFEIPNLPPGDYTLVAHHENLGVEEVKVKLGPSARQNVSFTLTGEQPK